MIEMYTSFVARHFTLHDGDATEWGSGYLVAHKIAELFDQKGERIAGVERTLTRLERDVPDGDAVGYLRALFYRREMYVADAAERATLRRKAGAALLALARDGRGPYRRRALATLASLHFEENDYRTAGNYFREFIDEYPESDWAWVAALRIAQTQEALNQLDASVGSYRAAAARYASIPQARVLAHVYAARLLEAKGAVGKAAAEYRMALAGWDANYERQFSLFWPSLPPTPERPFAEDRGVVYREDLSPRIAELRRTNSLPGGALLERGRWLLGRQQWIEAEAVLREAMTAYPQSPAIDEAREMLHRARLSAILDLADADHASVEETKTLDDLAALAREPYTFRVSAAKIASATILRRRGANAEAQALMTAALQELHARQRRSLRHLRTPLEKDIAAIQDLVFRPKGDGIFAGTRWEGDPFDGGSAAFVVVDSDIRVTLAGESVERVTSNHVPTAGQSSVLLLDEDQQSVFANIITKLGGTGRRDAVAVMEPPNQPDARADEIVTFWNGFFRMRPGHWSGWMFSTNPVITGIEFQDVARTKAYAQVTIGYEGATVALEKKGGAWKALGMGGRWIQ
jgi:tetratricopeptide (TPR) repeat protein